MPEIPTIWQAEIGGSRFKASTSKKLIRSSLKNNPDIIAVVPATRKMEVGGCGPRPAPGKSSKANNGWEAGMAQVVEFLHSKLKSVSLNPVLPK
jgi:hypothetical protein